MDAPDEQDSRGGWGRKLGWEFGPFLTLGLQLAIAVVVFFFLGRWVDSKLGTAPWCMLAGLALGIIGGFVQFFRTAIALGEREDKEAEEERKHPEREGE
jgi:F0F1-type ATP synthase assembly protein I